MFYRIRCHKTRIECIAQAETGDAAIRAAQRRFDWWGMAFHGGVTFQAVEGEAIESRLVFSFRRAGCAGNRPEYDKQIKDAFASMEAFAGDEYTYVPVASTNF